MREGQTLGVALASILVGCFPSFGDLSGGAQNDANAAATSDAPFDAGGAFADASAETLGTSDAAAEADVESPVGLVGNYYANPDFTGKNQLRVDATINFDWGYDAPLPGFVNDHFSVRWTGKVTPRFSETYTFYATSDDGAVLWIDGAKVIDDWVPHRAKEDTTSIALVAGQKYDIKLEYYDGGNEALMTLAWSSTSQAKEIIPAGQLTP